MAVAAALEHVSADFLDQEDAALHAGNVGVAGVGECVDLCATGRGGRASGFDGAGDAADAGESPQPDDASVVQPAGGLRRLDGLAA